MRAWLIISARTRRYATAGDGRERQGARPLHGAGLPRERGSATAAASLRDDKPPAGRVPLYGCVSIASVMRA